MNDSSRRRSPSWNSRLRNRGASALLRAGVCLVAALLAACSGGGGGGGGDAVTSAFLAWNQTAIDASGTDHASGAPEQLGPCRASRAMAIVHIAMFEAVIAIQGGFPTQLGLAPSPATASTRAAIAQAAHDTLVSLFPAQTATFDAELAADLAAIPAGPSRDQGVVTGQTAAAAILALRANDGSGLAEPLLGAGYVPGNQPGDWRQDPISMVPIALGAFWSQVDPFVMTSADQFRTPAPPALGSIEYALSFDEVRALGGDGVTSPTIRTAEQTFVGIFWAYDGTPSLCAPPRLYNQIARQIADDQGTRGVALARLLTLINVAMADAGIAAWESKYFYEFWRPVGGIREADPGTGPSGLGDGNPATIGDPNFVPLCAPASNTAGPNFTPPFPAYPSGHATFGGALFQVLRRFYATDAITFTFISDEFNGVTLDNQGNVRPLIPRTFNSLSEAEEENGQSRIYLGIHWSFDKVEGIMQGNSVGDLVFDTIYQPVP